MFKRGAAALNWLRLATPVRVAQVDFMHATEAVVDQSAGVKIERAGTVNGVLISFDLVLSASTTLTTHPDRVQPDNSWKYGVFLCVPRRVDAGTQLELTYRYRVPGQPSGVQVTYG